MWNGKKNCCILIRCIRVYKNVRLCAANLKRGVSLRNSESLVLWVSIQILNSAGVRREIIYSCNHAPVSCVNLLLLIKLATHLFHIFQRGCNLKYVDQTCYVWLNLLLIYFIYLENAVMRNKVVYAKNIKRTIFI